ncbi:hypothetical protein Ciccas_002214 [Cichlidogyrus casuarinus]|uniref:C2H2-type domain-containing protein n=1 Tax=Cichlidogyrus casuarinus TaxID=1844966 RepID=A0ABD2QHW8_9PLAT
MLETESESLQKAQSIIEKLAARESNSWLSTSNSSSQQMLLLNSHKKVVHPRGTNLAGFHPYVRNSNRCNLPLPRQPGMCDGTRLPGPEFTNTVSSQFICPNCNVDFLNRDTLAMHMMESVRSQACPGIQPKITPKPSQVINGKSPSLMKPETQSMAIAFAALLSQLSGNKSQNNFEPVASNLKPTPPSPTKINELISAEDEVPLMRQINSFAHIWRAILMSRPMIDKDSRDHGEARNVFANLPRSLRPFSVMSFTSSAAKTLSRPSPCKSAPNAFSCTLSKAAQREDHQLSSKTSETNDRKAAPARMEPSQNKDDTLANTLYEFHCKHCEMGFRDRALFSLHMGLHTVNEPWQCNMCGKHFSGKHDFTAHSLHF